jgi:hypothetical protein
MRNRERIWQPMKPLEERERLWLLDLLADIGKDAASKRLGVGRAEVVSASTGYGLMPETAALIHLGFMQDMGGGFWHPNAPPREN